MDYSIHSSEFCQDEYLFSAPFFAFEFFSKLPDKPYCSSDKDSFRRITTKKWAHKFDYIEPNTPWETRYLIFDIDHQNPYLSLSDSLLPPPTYFIYDPLSPFSGHIVYELSTPVFTGIRSSQKAQAFLRYIKHSFSVSLEADPGFNGVRTKNPLSPKWRTVWSGRKYELHELNDYCFLKPAYKNTYTPTFRSDFASSGRNCCLYEHGRIFASSINSSLSFDSFESSISDYCHRKNIDLFYDHPSGPLPNSEIKSISKSITKRYFRFRFASQRPNAGILRAHLVPAHSLEDVRRNQRAGAQFTNSSRRWKTVKKLLSCFKKLRRSKIHVDSAIDLARFSGLSRATIYRLLSRVRSSPALRKFFSGSLVSHGLTGVSRYFRFLVLSLRSIVQDFSSLRWSFLFLSSLPPPFSDFVNRLRR